jgi:HAD superfamily hydrolase (TIGR01662 family)
MPDLNLTPYKLIIFDVDGTIADRDSDQLYPAAADWFAQHGHRFHLALATNQGGVGLRHWMTHDKKNQWGNPNKYPTEEAIYNRMNTIMDQISTLLWESVYICFAYQTKSSGKWSPAPAGREWEPEWNPENRKPAPGMLHQAMLDANVRPTETLMVGDGDEDLHAAESAGCHFLTADTFFGRRSAPNQAA